LQQLVRGYFGMVYTSGFLRLDEFQQSVPGRHTNNIGFCFLLGAPLSVYVVVIPTLLGCTVGLSSISTRVLDIAVLYHFDQLDTGCDL
jgi:hypothetical protein